MKILDRYVLREFTSYLLLGLLGLIVVFIVVDVSEKLRVFLEHRAPLGLVLQFYLYLAPDVVVKVLPISLLLATFLALGQLNKFGELTAMRSAGLSVWRVLVPVFGVAAVCTLVSFALGEFVVPGTNRVRDRILEQQIQDVHRSPERERADVTYLGEGGRIWYMRLYLPGEKRMHEVSLQEFREGRLVRRIDAAEATWDGTRWQFTSGFMRTFDASGRERAEPFPRMTVGGLAERPDDFVREVRKPDDMNFLELSEYVVKLRSSGGRVANYLVDLHLKLAFPLVCMIVVMIGGALATRLRAQGAALGFGLSATISFVYYGFMRAGQALGHAGALPPYVAAWMGDAVFGIVGLVMMMRAQRR